MSSSSSAQLPAPGAWRQDASLIGLVGIAHFVSHFSQLWLPPLFPWLKDAFGASYAELGFLMTLFFVVSCAVQTTSGFVVDRFGPRPVLLGGLALLAVAAFGFAASTSYWMLAFFVVVAGLGNGVFHPVDYTLLNRKVHSSRLGHAYSTHGLTGTLGWALAPLMLVPIAMAYSWRLALAGAGTIALLVLLLLLFNRNRLDLPAAPRPAAQPDAGGAASSPAGEPPFAFLRIPAVWMCFFFFFFFAMALSVVQVFAPEAARQLHGMPLAMLAVCLSAYMLCSAVGMLVGGFLASDPERCERVVGIGFAFAAAISLLLGLGHVPGTMVPALFGAMGLLSGVAGPSRDLLVKRTTPDNATGRVYGVVYSGLDTGQAVAPLIFGVLMDRGNFRGVLVGLAIVQAVLIVSAFRVRHVRRTPLEASAAGA